MPPRPAAPDRELLRFLTCGSVDDGKSTLIGRLLHDSGSVPEDQLAAAERDSRGSAAAGGGIDLALATPQDVTAQLANGTITLTVPRRPYQVSITHQNGPVSLGVPNDPSAQYHLDLRVKNGDISVQPS